MKTLQKVLERFYWNNVQSDVEKCCHAKVPENALEKECSRIIWKPFERITFDILGPLPRSSDGNSNILVVMNYFTKWPEAYPISNHEASNVAQVQHWISRFGVPLQMHSDQGRNFDYAVRKKLCEIHGIDKTRATTLHPQSDGMVETSAVHETNGYSPSQMLVGRDIRLPKDLLFSRPPDAPFAPEEYV
ncbi:retrovirus-related Pol polyprotein from transposon 412 [Trichonephila clavipes]|nr:retrovirus-related Pol polyprotein from transposon 412 [Trichonephila clavipes]